VSTNQRWTAADLPDMRGRSVVITGGGQGLGELTARALARAGAKVVLAVRDLAKGERVAADIGGDAEARPLDLASLASIRAFAQAWNGDLDVLINNAGIMQVPAARTADGFELQLGTNHLGHFALTNLLLNHITDRVVVVTSALHSRGHIQLDDLNWERRPYNSLQAYRDSKLANVLFAFELQRRLTQARSNVRAVVAHPGIAPTTLASHIGGFVGFMQRRVTDLLGNDLDHAILPALYAASQDLPGGAFIGPNGFGHLRGYPAIQELSPAALDTETASALWALSTQLTHLETEVEQVR